jgi:ATP-dependent Lon protease
LAFVEKCVQSLIKPCHFQLKLNEEVDEEGNIVKKFIKKFIKKGLGEMNLLKVFLNLFFKLLTLQSLFILTFSLKSLAIEEWGRHESSLNVARRMDKTGTMVASPGGIMIPLQSCEAGLEGVSQYFAEHSIYSMEAVNRAFEEESALGNEKGLNRIRILESMMARGSNRFVLGPPRDGQVDILQQSSANFEEVIGHISRRIKLNRKAGESMTMEPILLLGPPGVGKTHFAKLIAKTIGTDYKFISMATTTAGFVLAGNASQWKGSKPGEVATALVKGTYANPVMLVDEIDKASTEGAYDPINPFYSLLEWHTAREFTDEFLNVPVDASQILWVLTANDASRIPEPILNRAHVFEIRMPTREENRGIMKSIYAGILAEHPKYRFDPELSEDVLEKLDVLAARDGRRVLMEALGYAATDDRDELIAEDIRHAKAATKKNTIGFIQ